MPGLAAYRTPLVRFAVSVRLVWPVLRGGGNGYVNLIGCMYGGPAGFTMSGYGCFGIWLDNR